MAYQVGLSTVIDDDKNIINIINADVSGIITASSFVGDITGNATGLSGTPNLNVGIVTASSFDGDLTGTASTATAAATAYGLSGSPDITVGVVTATSGLSLSNSNITGIKNATFNTQNTIATTSGSITVDWTTAQNQKQTEPTGTITYTFTAPPGPCHLQLLIDSDGTSTAQTINWPGSVTFLGSSWSGENDKKAVINFWYDGTNYLAIGTNEA